MLGAPMARAQLARARSGVCGHRKSQHSLQRLAAAPRARRRALGRRLCLRRPSGPAPMAAPCLRGGHPGRPQLDGARGGGEGRGGDLMAEAARQATGAAGSGVFPKTWRRRLAVWGAGVADRDERMSSGAPQVEIGGEGQVGGQRTVSAAPEARRPGPAGWRGCSSALRSARCGLCR